MNISLEQLRIASPCTASWDDMAGDERSRFCGQCRLNVYNLAAMTQGEAERLISKKEGRVCVRLYKRSDGTVITRDCPVGVSALRRRTAWIVSKVAAGLAVVIGGAAWAVNFGHPYRERVALDGTQPLAALTRWLQQTQQPQVQIMMGDIALPPTAVPVPPPPAPESTNQP
jgi:hypothetical protein